MKPKLLFWIVAILLVANPVLATIDSSKYLLYLSFDAGGTNATTTKDSANKNTATNSGAILNSTGKIGESVYIDTSSDYISMGFSPYLNFTSTTTARTIAWWHRINQSSQPCIGVGSCIILGTRAAVNDMQYGIGFDWTGGSSVRPTMSSYTRSSGNTYTGSFNLGTNDTWTFYVYVFDQNSDYIAVYENGVLKQNYTAFTQVYSGSYAGQDYRIGNPAYDPGGWDAPIGYFDELQIYDDTMTQGEINSLYNLGSGWNPFTSPEPFANLTITAADELTSSPTSNINATLCNGATCYSYTNSSGERVTTEILTNSTLLWNISVASTNYFNRSYLNQNVSSGNLVAYLHQAELCLNATSRFSGSYITPINFTINSTTRTSCFNITAGTHNVQAQKTGWYSKNQTFVIAALSNTTQTIENMSSSLANITVYYSNGTKISNWNISITSNNYPFWPAENGSTSSGSYNFSGINGTYTAIVNDVIGTETFTFTLNAYTQNISFYHFGIDNCTAYHVPTMNFTIWNEETAALLNNSALNIYLEITSSYYPGNKTYNFSFSTGNYYALCVPNNTITGWTAYAQAEYSNLPNYDEKNYYLVNYNLSNTSANIDLYLAYNTSQLKLKVRDYTDQGISNAYIKVLSYDLGTNSYKTTEILKSDSSGDAYAEIIPNTQWYAFIVEYNGRIYLQTLPTKIITSELTLRISLTSDYFTNYNIVAGIASILFYNNATSTFSFTYDDPTGNVQQGCLQVTERNAFRDSVLNTTCVNSSASTILISIAGVAGNYTYIASSYAMIDGISIPLNSTSVNLNTTYKMFGALGWLITFLLVITLILVGCWHPSVAIVLAVFGIIASVIMNFIYVTWTSIVVLVIIGAIALYRVGNKPN